MQETFSIGIGGEDCVAKKNELKVAAKAKNMSVSAFLMWLFENYKKRQERKVNAAR